MEKYFSHRNHDVNINIPNVCSPSKSPALSQSKLAPNFYFKMKHDEQIHKKLDFNPNSSKDHYVKTGSENKLNFIGTHNSNFTPLTSSGKKFSDNNTKILDFLKKK